jgi:ribosomal protein L4
MSSKTNLLYAENVVKSTRNLSGIKIIPANLLNVIDILSYKMLLMPVAAVRKAEKIWGEKRQRGDNATLRSIEPSINN